MRRDDTTKTTNSAALAWRMYAEGLVLRTARHAARAAALRRMLVCAVLTVTTLAAADGWASDGASSERTPSTRVGVAHVSPQGDEPTAPMADADVAAPVEGASSYLSGPPPEAASTSGARLEGQRSYLDGASDERSSGSSDEGTHDAMASDSLAASGSSAEPASDRPPRNVLLDDVDAPFAPALMPDPRTLLEITMMTERAQSLQARRQSRFLVATGVAALAASVGLLYLGGKVEAKHAGDGGDLVKMGVGSLAASLSVFSASAVTFRNRQQSRHRYRIAAQKHDALLRGAESDVAAPVGPYFGVTGEGVGVSF